MAHGIRRAAEVMLVRAGVASLVQRVSLPSTIVLAYHNVVPRGEPVVGDRSLHIDQDAFAEQLDLITERATVVSLSEAMGSETARGDARVVITFDDAYRGAMTVGLDELERRGLPATVFVAPGLLGSRGFWWDRLATGEGDTALPSEVRSHALDDLRGGTDEVLRWAAEQGLRLHEVPDHARPVTATELTSLPASPRITFGAHTWSHPNLARLEPPEVSEELRRSRDWLTEHVPTYVDWLAYPYGLRNHGVVREAEACFTGALLIEGGAAERRGVRDAPAHEVPRLNIPRGVSPEGIRLRLAGVLT